MNLITLLTKVINMNKLQMAH